MQPVYVGYVRIVGEGSRERVPDLGSSVDPGPIIDLDTDDGAGPRIRDGLRVSDAAKAYRDPEAKGNRD